jgi:hypothetical protein
MKNIKIMKRLLLLALSSGIFITTQAQNINVTEQNVLFLNGQQPALVTMVYNNSMSTVMDKWKSFLKSYKNEKIKADKSGEIFGDNVLIKDWGNNPVDIYARFEENKADQSVKLMVAFDLGGAYLTSSGDAAKYSSAEGLVKNFAIETTKAPVADKKKDAEKVLSRLESDRESQEKSIKSLKSDIESYKDKISKAEKDIEKGESDLSKKKSEIDAQRTTIQLLNSQIEGIK